MHFGADSMWTSAAAAFECLPRALQVLYLSLDVEHDTTYMALRHDFAPAGKLADIVALNESAVHPAVIRHPFNDRLCLFVGNGYTKRVHGYSAEQGEHLIKLAIEQAKILEIRCACNGSPGMSPSGTIWVRCITASPATCATSGAYCTGLRPGHPTSGPASIARRRSQLSPRRD